MLGDATLLGIGAWNIVGCLVFAFPIWHLFDFADTLYCRCGRRRCRHLET